MAFHRFTQPTYAGIGALPAAPSVVAFNGVNYNFINVVSGGTGASGSANADAYKGSGPNTGSYFVSFGEDASSLHANRGMRALAENTDYLDDLLNRELAVPVRTSIVTPGAPVPTIALGAATFVGNTLTYPLAELFSIVDQNDNEILVGSAKVIVSSIAGAAVGDGYSAGAITLTLNVSIPTGQQYRVYYATRSSLAAMPADTLAFIKVRGAQEVEASVAYEFTRVKGAFSATWDAAVATDLTHLAYSGLNERYNRSTTTVNLPPDGIVAENLVAYGLNTAGSGHFFNKTGPGMLGISQYEPAAYQSEAPSSLLFGGVWNAYVYDKLPTGTADPEDRTSITSGFTFIGHRDTETWRGDRIPGIYSFLHTAQMIDPDDSFAVDITKRTQIIPGTAVSIVGDVLTLGVGFFYNDPGTGFDETDILLLHDVVRCIITVSGQPKKCQFLIKALNSATEAVVLWLDGSSPDFAATVGTVHDWHKSIFSVSDNPFTYREKYLGLTGVTSDDLPGGMFFNAETTGYKQAFRLVGDHADISTEPVLEWGYRDFKDANKGEFVALGQLLPSGAVTATTVTAANVLGTTRSFGTVLASPTPPQLQDQAGAAVGYTQMIRLPIIGQGLVYDPAEWTVNSNTLPFSQFPKLVSTVASSAFSIAIRPYHGARLKRVYVWFASAAHVAEPVMPQVSMYRVGNMSPASALASWTANTTDLLSGGSPSAMSAPGSAPAYELKIHRIPAILSTVGDINVIDNETYMYWLLVEDESGANAVTGNVYFAIDLEYEDIDVLYPTL